MNIEHGAKQVNKGDKLGLKECLLVISRRLSRYEHKLCVLHCITAR